MMRGDTPLSLQGEGLGVRAGHRRPLLAEQFLSRVPWAVKVVAVGALAFAAQIAHAQVFGLPPEVRQAHQSLAGVVM
ncbi:MAG: hypothetical protein C4340_04665, partial [Armatimonadota bacterium]